MQQYCIVDVETTGANKQGQKITEIAIIKTDGQNILDEFSSLINPERRIPLRITYLTGITNEMVQAAPKFYEVAKKIIEITQDCIFVAHNVFFDYQFIQREFSDLGFQFRRQLFCTVKNSRSTFPGLTSYSLKNLSKHFNIELKNHHRAMSDTRAAFELFKKIQQQIKNPIIQNAPTPSKLEDEKYAHLPEACGVYYFYSESGELLYVGKSTNIKNRIKSHFRLDLKRKKDIQLKGQIAHIDFKLYPHDIVAKIVESMEIKKYRPPFNTALKRNRYRYHVVMKKDVSGRFQFQHQTIQFSDIGIKSKSKKHSERIITNLLNKAFGDANHFLWEKTLPIHDYNNRVEKVFNYYFYPSENFIKTIETQSGKILFEVKDNELKEIKYKDKNLIIKEDPDIKKIFLKLLTS